MAPRSSGLGLASSSAKSGKAATEVGSGVQGGFPPATAGPSSACACLAMPRKESGLAMVSTKTLTMSRMKRANADNVRCMAPLVRFCHALRSTV